jgi:ABC-type glycerol-3-phosphate transport system permease component
LAASSRKSERDENLLDPLPDVMDRKAVAPVTVRMSSLVNSLGQNWHLLTAAAFVTMALPLAVFFSLQRYFVQGILAGAVKG